MPLTARRSFVAEWMDQPDLDERMHRQALLALDRMNAVSRTATQVWGEILKRLASINQRSHGGPAPPPAEYSVLDVACGSAGLLIGLWKRASRAGIRLRLAGCDISATALALAREQAEMQGAGIDLEQIDVTRQPFSRRYDFVISSLFLHHLTDEQAMELVQRMADAARLAVIVSDLRRTRLGYAYAWLGTRLLSRSTVAHFDGPRSVARAFTTQEAQRIAEQAGLTNAAVKKRWPQRFLLHWWRT